MKACPRVSLRGINTLSGETTQSKVLPPFRNGSKFFPVRVDPLFRKVFGVQEIKQEVAKVVPLVKISRNIQAYPDAFIVTICTKTAVDE